MFADRAKIYIKSGKGGDGHVSFRREKYVAAGGPDGGDGGRGGSIIFEVDDGLNTLINFRHRRKYVAADGEEGGRRRCHGADAEDLVVKVPEGTVIKDFETGKVIADMSGSNRREVILRGGRGGTGNMHYATATMQVPKYAKPGQNGREMYVQLELKCIADVGLVGYPNAGKSTLLSRVSNARPKIAGYQFTTLEPQLGVVDLEGGGFVMADIPGLIEGAADGVGLGHDFLRHIERCRLLVQVVDAAGTEGRDPVDDLRVITQELARYDKTLLDRPRVIAANKIDSIDPAGEDPVERIRRAFPELPVYPVSGATGEGIKELLGGISKALENAPAAPLTFEKEFEIDYSDRKDLPYTVEVDKNGVYVVEGPRIEKMLGYTNLDSEKGFDFFQRFLKDSGILDELTAKGIREGDTVRMYGHEFDYYQ